MLYTVTVDKDFGYIEYLVEGDDCFEELKQIGEQYSSKEGKFIIKKCKPLTMKQFKNKIIKPK